MRQGQSSKRGRGRGRKPQNSSNRTMDSNGPDVKIRGTAAHIFEKYQALARDAQVSDDRISAENYLQHAEHYYRLILAAQQPADGQPRLQQGGQSQGGQSQGGQQHGEKRSDVPEEVAAADGTDAGTDVGMMQGGGENQEAGEGSGNPRQRSSNRRRRPRQEANGSGEAQGNVAADGVTTEDAPAAHDEDAAAPEGATTV